MGERLERADHGIARIQRLVGASGGTKGYEIRCRCGEALKLSSRSAAIQGFYDHVQEQRS